MSRNNFLLGLFAETFLHATVTQTNDISFSFSIFVINLVQVPVWTLLCSKDN